MRTNWVVITLIIAALISLALSNSIACGAVMTLLMGIWVLDIIEDDRNNWR